MAWCEAEEAGEGAREAWGEAKTEASEAEAGETEAGETEASETEASETKTSETEASKTKAGKQTRWKAEEKTIRKPWQTRKEWRKCKKGFSPKRQRYYSNSE